MKQKPPTEEQDQIRLFEWAHLQKGKCPELGLLNSSANGVRLPIGLAVKTVRLGLRKGYPDIFLPVARKGYHGLYIELKRVKGGKVSPEQEWWLEKLTEQGYYAVVCKGADEAIKTIIDYLEGKL